MWLELLNEDQLEVNLRIRQVLLEGNDSYEWIYKVEKIGEYYFFVRLIERDNREINEENQEIFYYKTKSLRHYGFEIESDKDSISQE